MSLQVGQLWATQNYSVVEVTDINKAAAYCRVRPWRPRADKLCWL